MDPEELLMSLKFIILDTDPNPGCTVKIKQNQVIGAALNNYFIRYIFHKNICIFSGHYEVNRAVFVLVSEDT